jgi:ethanolaminephosphotransferase
MNLVGLEITITSLISQYVSFFAFGGSNAISSIDLSSAYNGVGNYNVFLVGFLTFLSNWAGPIWWVSATHLIHPRWGKVDRQNYFAVLTFHSAMMLLAIMAACTVLRTHLFIWTVFSPKFLYTTAWVAAHHILINMLREGLTLL